MLDGGDLATILVFANRLPMMHREDWAGPRVNSGTAFAWFCWRRGWGRPPTLRRIAWSKEDERT